MSERPEPAPRQETARGPEYLQFKDGQIGIQARLLKEDEA